LLDKEIAILKGNVNIEYASPMVLGEIIKINGTNNSIGSDAWVQTWTEINGSSAKIVFNASVKLLSQQSSGPQDFLQDFFSALLARNETRLEIRQDFTMKSLRDNVFNTTTINVNYRMEIRSNGGVESTLYAYSSIGEDFIFGRSLIPLFIKDFHVSNGRIYIETSASMKNGIFETSMHAKLPPVMYRGDPARTLQMLKAFYDTVKDNPFFGGYTALKVSKVLIVGKGVKFLVNNTLTDRIMLTETNISRTSFSRLSNGVIKVEISPSIPIHTVTTTITVQAPTSITVTTIGETTTATNTTGHTAVSAAKNASTMPAQHGGTDAGVVAESQQASTTRTTSDNKAAMLATTAAIVFAVAATAVIMLRRR
jgi:hypothetical protein